MANCLKKSCSSTPIGLLKKHARCLQHADLAAPLRQQGQPGQVEHQRRRQDRVAALPDELQHHLRAQEALEVDVVPGRLPVVQRFDVLDRDVRLRLVADDLRRSPGPWSGSSMPCWPGRRAPGRRGCRRCCGPPSSGSANCAGRTSAPAPSSAAFRRSCRPCRRMTALRSCGQFLGGRERRAERRREVDVGQAQIERRPGIQALAGQHRQLAIPGPDEAWQCSGDARPAAWAARSRRR